MILLRATKKKEPYDCRSFLRIVQFSLFYFTFLFITVCFTFSVVLVYVKHEQFGAPWVIRIHLKIHF